MLYPLFVCLYAHDLRLNTQMRLSVKGLIRMYPFIIFPVDLDLLVQCYFLLMANNQCKKSANLVTR